MTVKRWDRRLEVRDHAVPEKFRASVDDGLSVASNETPLSLLLATETDEDECPVESEKRRLAAERQRRMDVRVRQFVLFAEFVSVGVSEIAQMKLRSLIMLRMCAPELLKSRYQLTAKASIKEEKKLLASLPFGFEQREWVPLAFTLASPLAGRHSAIDDDEEWCAEELSLDVRALRMLRFGEFCAEIATDAPTIPAFAKTLASLLRRVKTEFISRLGESQADLGRKFGETRATVQAREVRAIEAPLREQGQAGFKLLGGTKSESHRRACKRAQKGNSNRRTGERRKAERDAAFSKHEN